MNRKLGLVEVGIAFVVVAFSFVCTLTGADELVTMAIASLAFSVLIWPVLVFVHELGHAVAAVAFTGQRVVIRMGGDPYLVRFALGRIDVRYHPSGYIAHCAMTSWRMSRLQLAAVSLAGPAASLAFGLAILFAAPAWPEHWLIPSWPIWVAGGCSILVGVGNAIPYRDLPQWLGGSLESEEGPSDGLLAVQALRGEHTRRHVEGPADAADAGPRRHPATDAVLEATAAAEGEARALGSHELGTEHLLLGLLCAEDAAAKRVLHRLGVTAEAVRERIARTPPAADGPASDELGVTPAARRAVDAAGRALSLRGDYRVRTEHLLLGLVSEKEGLAMEVLADLGVEPAALRRAAIEELHGAPVEQPPVESDAVDRDDATGARVDRPAPVELL